MTWIRTLGASLVCSGLVAGCFSPGAKDEDTDGATDGQTDDASATLPGTDSQSDSDSSPTSPTSESDSDTSPNSATDSSSSTTTETSTATETGDPTGDTDDTTGPAPACDDGNADPGELCLDGEAQLLEVARDPRFAAVGDVDSDGAPDIVTANYVQDAEGTISVLESDGVGGFAPAQNHVAVLGAEVVRIADGDGDGDDDIIVFGAGARTYTNADGAFLSGTSTQIPGPFAPGIGDLRVVDVNGDDYLDVFSSEPYGYGFSFGAVESSRWSFPSAPDGGFPIPGEGASGIIAVTFAYDGDTAVDAVALNQYSSTGAIVHGNGAGGMVSNDETVQLCQGQFAGVRHGEGGDLDGDGDVDLVATCTGGDFTVVLGNGDGTFEAPQVISLDGAFRPVLADVDNDGDLDVFVSSSTIERVVLYLNDGSAGLELSELDFTVAGSVWGFAVADVNDDGALDLVVPFDDGAAGRVALYLATP